MTNPNDAAIRDLIKRAEAWLAWRESEGTQDWPEPCSKIIHDLAKATPAPAASVALVEAAEAVRANFHVRERPLGSALVSIKDGAAWDRLGAALAAEKAREPGDEFRALQKDHDKWLAALTRIRTMVAPYWGGDFGDGVKTVDAVAHVTGKLDDAGIKLQAALIDHARREGALLERAADAKVEGAREALGRVASWVRGHGPSLRPESHPGAADTFGDGMRAAKQQVDRILADYVRDEARAEVERLREERGGDDVLRKWYAAMEDPEKWDHDELLARMGLRELCRRALEGGTDGR